MEVFPMTYENMTDMIDLKELEVQAEDVAEISAASAFSHETHPKACRKCLD